MSIRSLLKKNEKLYTLLSNKKQSYRFKKALDTKYTFEDRNNGSKELCIILAGYKQFLYDEVFGRIAAYIPKNIDVCIISSGIYSNELSHIAKKNNWSYLSTKINCVTIAQNVAISIFDKAEYIYKLDEDIFVTKGYFEKIKETYEYVNTYGEYTVGFVAPLIPINGYGHYKILEKLDLLEYYNNHFEHPRYEAGPHRMIENSATVAKFMWGEGNIVPSIDEMNDMFMKEKLSYSSCGIRFSIGAIYFSKQTWKDMGMFKPAKGTALGLDELQLCEYCISFSKAIIVSENTVVGHLSFGRQNAEMKDYYLSNIKVKSNITN